MADKRILSAAQSLLVGPSPATGAQPSGSILQIHRLQSAGYDFTRQFEDVNQLGTFAPIDRIEVDLPQISLNATYLATNVRNESGIGLYVGGDQSILKNILDDTQREKNYYLRVVPDGNAAAGYTGTNGGVVAFGNGVLASYQAQGEVGGFATAQFTINALDALWTNTSTNFDTPAVNANNGQPISAISVTLPPSSTGLVGQASALRRGDITVDIDGAGFGVNNICIQSYNIQADFNLEPILCLGSPFPTSREPTFPMNCSMSIDANMRDIGTGRLSTLRCGSNKYNLSVTLRAPTCDGTLGAIKAVYYLRGATLESQGANSTIGPSKSMSMSFTAPITGPQETGAGFFMSGSLT